MTLNLLVNVAFVLFFAAKQVLLVIRKYFNLIYAWLRKKADI